MGSYQDFNTGTGYDQRDLVGIALPSATGAVPGGTTDNPLHVIVDAGGGGGGGQVVTVGSGATDATTTRAVAATDSPEVAALGTAGSSPPSLPGSATGVIGFLRLLYEQAVSLLGRLPAALVGGRVDVNVGAVAAQSLKYQTPGGGSSIGGSALDSKADGSNSGNIDWDNSTSRHEFVALDCVLGSYTATSGGTWTLRVLISADGTNYEDSAGGDTYSATVTSGASGKRFSFSRVRAYPFKMRFVLTNNSGGTSAASGNSLTLYPYGYRAE